MRHIVRLVEFCVIVHNLCVSDPVPQEWMERALANKKRPRGDLLASLDAAFAAKQAAPASKYTAQVQAQANSQQAYLHTKRKKKNSSNGATISNGSGRGAAAGPKGASVGDKQPTQQASSSKPKNKVLQLDNPGEMPFSDAEKLCAIWQRYVRDAIRWNRWNPRLVGVSGIVVAEKQQLGSRFRVALDDQRAVQIEGAWLLQRSNNSSKA
ncbi:hypothetical protein PybrP1_008253 [[Pythium] brassicae (nom. inval.)]|nr:hypothetical protein PybrP1_008253 [[Pythium] brassicae (nom. inval.)]